MKALVTKLNPLIDAALRPLGAVSPVIKGRARLATAQAIKAYKPLKGAKLTTYVTSNLRSVLRDAPAIQDPLPMPEKQRRELNTLHTATEQFKDKLGRDPSDEEMASVLGMPLKKVIKLRSGIRAKIPMSVQEEGEGDDDEGGNPDIATSTHTPYDDWLEAVYHGLGDIDKVIFQHRTGYRNADKLSTNEISAKVGLTPAAVSQRARRLQEQLDQFHGQS